MNPDRLSRLKSELAAIELWDSYYYRTEHDKIAEDAFRARQERGKELLDEIARALLVQMLGPHLGFRRLEC